MNQAAEQIGQTSEIAKDTLKKIAPFSRHPWARGRQYFRPLRDELLHAPKDSIHFVPLKIRKLLELSAAFATPQVTDRLARRLGQRFRDDLVHPHWVRCMIYQRRFGVASKWADRSAGENPDDPVAQIVAGNCAMIMGDAPKALEIFKAYLKRGKDTSDAAASYITDILVEAGEHSWLHTNVPQIALNSKTLLHSERLAPADGQTPIYCISLAQDHRRLAATTHFLGSAGRLRPVPAVLGATLPQAARAVLGKGNVDTISAAEFGCSLSHLAAWEQIAAECGADEYALVAEDDSRFVYGPGRGLSEMTRLARKHQAGLVFINRRACSVASVIKGADDIGLFAVPDIFADPAAHTGRRDPGWGGDGYLLNGETAQKLVDAFAEVQVMGAVDWQLFALCFDVLPDWLSQRITRNIYDGLTARGTWPVIRGYVTNLPIMQCRDFGYSSINSQGRA